MSVPTGGGAPATGRRFNKLPALIAVALVGLFLVAFFYAVAQRSKERVASTGPEKVFDVGTADPAIDFLEGKPDGLAGANRDDIGEQAVEQDSDDGLAESLRQYLADRELSTLKRKTEQRDQIEQAQYEEYMQAMKSSSKVEGFKERERNDASIPDVIIPAAANDVMASSQANDPMAAILASLTGGGGNASGGGTGGIDPERISTFLASPQGQSALAQLGVGGAAQGAAGASRSGSAHRSATDTSAASQGQAFVAQQAPQNDDQFVLQNRSRAPRSPYELKTGAIVSGAMISAANSDLPGDILAQVTKNVYDTATGRFVLVPQGTKLFGRYDAFTQLGQERLLIVWNRLVFPDGETLDIGGMQGYDDRGLSGFKDKVNTHFLRTLGNALLISLVNASGQALIDSVNEPGDSVLTLNLAQDFSDTSSRAFNEYLQNRLRIKPTLEIRAGYRFNIIVSKDIDFEGPYERGFAAYRVGQ